MTPETPTSQVNHKDMLAEMTETLEQSKVELTPQIREYITNHAHIIQDKFQ